MDNIDITVCYMQRSIEIKPYEKISLPLYYHKSQNTVYDGLCYTTILDDERNLYVSVEEQLINMNSKYSDFNLPISNCSNKTIHYEKNEPIAVLTPLCTY